jgi:hypothetical protein
MTAMSMTFRYHNDNENKTYTLCKEGSDGLRCHVVMNPLRHRFTLGGHSRTFDRVWGLLLTTETDRHLNTTFLLKAIYGMGLRLEGPRPWLHNTYIPAPMSSVKMRTKFLWEVQASDWPLFVPSLEEWAARCNVQLVHDYAGAA